MLGALADSLRDQVRVAEPKSTTQKTTAHPLGELMLDPEYRMARFHSACILNDYQDVRRLLSKYADPFIEMWDRSGDNCISLAAVEGALSVLQLLEGKGANIHSINAQGRTPLMEAALWGRANIVDLSLSKGADPRVKDKEGKTALKLAEENRGNAKERERRGCLYKEPSKAAQLRRIIFNKPKLRVDDQISNVVASSSGIPCVTQGIFTSKASGNYVNPCTISFYELGSVYNVKKERKTIARLDRGPLFQIVSAISGWNGHRPNEETLDNSIWMPKVLQLCQIEGFTVSPHPYDSPGRTGSFNACHAELPIMPKGRGRSEHFRGGS